MIRKLGKYSIVDKLGEGAMGAVYRAYDEVLDRHVAIKTMAEDIKWEPELKLRFYREARSAAGLLHPNIVTIHDLGEEGEITYIVMEILEGKDLRTLIAERAPVSLERKLQIMIQVSDGLHHAHSKGIIHRDIKPGNIHITPSGNVKILDFGIAHIPSSDLTGSGIRLGTPIYMSPEQVKGAELDARADIFSAGIVFYELLTYIHPFRDKNIVKTLDNILFQERLPFPELMPDAPPGLWQILSKCLEKKPESRYASMAEVGRDCRHLLEEVNAAAMSMTREGGATLDSLRKAARPQAAAGMTELLHEAEVLFGRRERPDYLSLKRILKKLAAEAPLPARDDDATSAGATAGEAHSLVSTATSLEPVPSMQSAALPAETVSAPERDAGAGSREADRIAGLMAKGESALERNSYAEASACALEAIRIDPNHPETYQLLQRIAQSKEQARRSEEAALLAGKARDALEAGDLELAAAQAEEALKVVADLPEAVACLDRVRQLQEERAREIDRNLGAAHEALSRGDLEGCENLISRVLASDSQNRRAMELQQKLADARERARLEHLSGLLARGAEALKAGDEQAARECAQEVLRMYPKNPDAAQLMLKLDQRARQHAEAAALVGRCREALQGKRRDEAGMFARQALERDPECREAKSLLEEMGRSLVAGRDTSSEETWVEPPSESIPPQAMEASMEETVILKPEGARKTPWLLAGTAALILLVLAGVGGTLYWKRKGPTPVPQDLTAQLSEARGALDQRMFDNAITLAQRILAASPGNPQAQALLAEAQKKKNQAELDVLLLEAQNLRSQGQLDAAAQVVEKILARQPDYGPALGLRAQLDEDMAASKSKEEQDKLISGWLTDASTFLAADKLAEAKAELDKIARLRPDAPELAPLRRQLRDKTAEAARRISNDEALKLARINDLRENAAKLFRQGKYGAVAGAVETLLAEAPGDSRGLSLRSEAAAAADTVRLFESTLAGKQYEDATNALSHLEKINPADPTLPELRKRLESRKASARATLAVLPLGEAGTLTLDDQTVGSNGEMESRSVAIGRHKLVARFSGGKQSSITFNLDDGENLTLVYDGSGAPFRPMVDADRELLASRKASEEEHSYPVEHRHSILGKCTGELVIGALRVQYRTANKPHSFSFPIKNVSLTVNNEKVELENKATGQKYSFKARNPGEAAGILRQWEKLQQLSR